MIKALICDLGGKGIYIIANLLKMTFNTVKSYYLINFKTETLFVNVSLNNLRDELTQRYGYTKKTYPCKSTLLRLLTDLDYGIQKVKKQKY